MQRLFCVILTCIVIISLLAGCSALQKLGYNDNDEVCPVSSISLSEADARQIANKVPIYLYFANEEGTKLKLEVRYIPSSEAAKSVNNLASVIVKELINGPSKDSGLKPTIPSEAKLRATVKIDGEVATVDFSKEFKEKHAGGKAQEQLTIYSIVNSLTELKEVSKVKFLIDGKKTKDFKGNFKFDSEFPRTTSLISKEVETIATVGDDKSKESDKEDKNDKDSKDSSDKDKKDDKKEESTKSEADVFDEKQDEAAADVFEEDEEAAFYFEDELFEDEILE